MRDDVDLHVSLDEFFMTQINFVDYIKTNFLDIDPKVDKEKESLLSD